MVFYQLKVYRKYTEMPLISFLVDAQSRYGCELGRWALFGGTGGGLPFVDSCSYRPDTKEDYFKKGRAATG